MTITIHSPLAGQLFGPGWIISAQTDRPNAPTISLWAASVTPSSATPFSTGFAIAWSPPGFSDVFGFDERFSPPGVLVGPANANLLQGATGFFELRLIDYLGATLEFVQFNILWDLQQGLPWLVTHPVGSGGGGGFTQADRDLLSNIYGAVHHVFPPSSL